LLASFKSRDVVTETVDVVHGCGGQESVDLCEIDEGRGREGIPRIDSPCDLAGVERKRYVVVHGRVERLRQVVLLSLLWIESSEEPELVFHDWTADVTAEVNF